MSIQIHIYIQDSEPDHIITLTYKLACNKISNCSIIKSSWENQ